MARPSRCCFVRIMTEHSAQAIMASLSEEKSMDTSLLNASTDDAMALVAATTSNHVYIKSDDFGWIPARVLEMQENLKAKVSVPIYRNEAAIQSDGGKKAKSYETRVVDLKEYPNQTLLLQNVDEDGQLKQVEDMVDLPFLHEVRELDSLTCRVCTNHCHWWRKSLFMKVAVDSLFRRRPTTHVISFLVSS